MKSRESGRPQHGRPGSLHGREQIRPLPGGVGGEDTGRRRHHRWNLGGCQSIAYQCGLGVFADQDRDVAGRDRPQTPVCAEQSAGTAEQGHNVCGDVASHDHAQIIDRGGLSSLSARSAVAPAPVRRRRAVGTFHERRPPDAR